MKGMIMKIATALASMAFVTAFIANGSASWLYMCEPEVPDCLK